VESAHFTGLGEALGEGDDMGGAPVLGEALGEGDDMGGAPVDSEAAGGGEPGKVTEAVPPGVHSGQNHCGRIM